jgi:uncharacterized membrane protein
VIVLNIVLFLVAPALICRLEREIKAIKLFGAVVWCYILGIIIGNLFPSESLRFAATQLSEITVLLSIPLLLFSTNILAWLKLAKKTLLSFVLVLVSVSSVSALSFYLFNPHVEDASKIASMLIGVFTGGTPNMIAIGKALEVKEEVFILMNASDLLMGGIYMLFLMTIGKRVFARFLPAFESPIDSKSNEQTNLKDCKQLNFKEKFKYSSLMLFISLALTGITLGLTHLIFSSLFVPFIIMSITAFGISLSFWKSFRELPMSFEVGQYLLLIFCMAIGSLANISDIINASGIYLAFCATTLFGSALLHFLLCFCFRIDRDTALITSVAAIYGPPFVGPFASVLNNRDIIVSGVTCGLVGYALGNYLGFGLFYLLN